MGIVRIDVRAIRESVRDISPPTNGASRIQLLNCFLCGVKKRKAAVGSEATSSISLDEIKPLGFEGKRIVLAPFDNDDIVTSTNVDDMDCVVPSRRTSRVRVLEAVGADRSPLSWNPAA